MTLEDTNVGASGTIIFSVTDSLRAAARRWKGVSIQRLTARLATGVGREVKIIGRIMPPATETRVGELACRNGLRGLAARAAPVAGGGGGGIGRGRRGARPLADAVEVEDGEAAGAGPYRRRPPHHVVTDHTLHGAAGELVLYFVDELGDGGGIGARRRRRRGSVRPPGGMGERAIGRM